MKLHSSLFTLIVLFISVTIFGQEGQTRFGFKAGVNFSSIASGQYNEGGIPRVGMLIGLVSEIPITPEISFAPELLYSHQGNVRRFNEMGSNSTTRTHLNYINVPLLFKYYINDNVSIDLGPYTGLNIIANSVIRSGGGAPSSTKIEEGINFFDAGITGSIGYMMSQDFFISARYSRGFTSVFDNTADSLGLRAKNSVFNLSFGLYL